MIIEVLCHSWNSKFNSLIIWAVCHSWCLRDPTHPSVQPPEFTFNLILFISCKPTMCKAQCLEGTIKLNKLWPVASNKLIFDFLFNIIGGIAFIYFYLFIFKFYFWLCWVFIAVHRLSLVAASGGCSSLPCVGFSLWWLLLWSTGSRAWAQ